MCAMGHAFLGVELGVRLHLQELLLGDLLAFSISLYLSVSTAFCRPLGLLLVYCTKDVQHQYVAAIA
ncbi:hypothetical protein M758_1G202300 [Ceratodon purpureus]|nr:hypothetical protein M758_1G202300 [Ceratodon purpureus]